MQTLMKCYILRHLSWVFAVCRHTLQELPYQVYKGLKKMSKQFVLKIASDLLSSSYSLYCLQSEHREEFFF